MESRERPTRADLRARRQSERRSGRGFPKQLSQSEVSVPTVERPSGTHPYLKELIKRVPFVFPVIASSVITACESREMDLSKMSVSASELGPAPQEAPTPGGVAEKMADFNRTIEEIGREPEMVMSQTPTAAEIRQELTPDSIFGIKVVRVEQSSEYTPEQIKLVSSELDLEIRERTDALLLAINRGAIDPKIEPETYRDMLRWMYTNATKFDKSNLSVREIGCSESLASDIYSALAENELTCVRNPGVQQIMEEVSRSGAVEAINQLVKDKAPASLFRNGTVPQIPTTKEGLLEVSVFAGNPTRQEFGPGMAWHNAPTVLGDGFCRLDPTNPEQMDMARQTIAGTLFHEFVHSMWQANAENPGGMTPSEASFFHNSFQLIFSHMAWQAMNLETGWDLEFLNWESVAVYGVLEEAGVEDPLVPMITSLVTLTPFDIYNQIRGPNDPSLEEIVSANRILDRLPDSSRERVVDLYEKYADKFVESYTRYIPGYID